MNYKLIAKKLRAVANELDKQLSDEEILAKLEHLLKTDLPGYLKWRNSCLDGWYGADTSTKYSAAPASKFLNEIKRTEERVKSVYKETGEQELFSSICLIKYSDSPTVGERETGEMGNAYIFYSSVYELEKGSNDENGIGDVFNALDYVPPHWMRNVSELPRFETQDSLIEDFRNHPF